MATESPAWGEATIHVTAMPELDSREPWFIYEAHAQGDVVDRTITAFSGALDEALDDRARGGSVQPTGAMAHGGGG